jgi:hypothetical protein
MAREPRAEGARRSRAAPSGVSEPTPDRREALRRGVLLGCAGLVSLLVLVGLSVAVLLRSRGTGAEVVADATVAAPPPVLATTTPSCGFQLGFAEFRDAAPDAVGDCVENEAPDLESGNSQQRTTNGLLVWRRADGLVAFTDGHRSWVRGPDGAVYQRYNDERFPFEAAPPGANLRVVPPGTPRGAATPSVPAASPVDAGGLRAYAAYMAPRFAALTAATTSSAALSDEAGRRPEALGEEEWRARMAAALGALRAAGDEVQRYQPVPERMRTVDALLVEIGRDAVLVADELAAGLDAEDADRIADAARRTESVAARTEAVHQEIAAIAGG